MCWTTSLAVSLKRNRSQNGMKRQKPIARANRVHSTLREVVLAMMEREGKDFSYCELGRHRIKDGRFDLHHTKYEGATYYDLQIACRKHNTAQENRFLS